MTVRQQQLLLDYLGFSPGQIDGVDGVKTQKARENFVGTYGVEVNEANLIGAVSGKLPKQKMQYASFWDEIRYVPRVEWRCPCKRCGGFPAEPQEKLVRFLEDLRIHFGKPVFISSGVRCQAHNDELPGSVWNSRHITGKAVDFCVEGMSATAVKVYCDRKVADGTLRYCYCIDNSFVHADVL